MWLNETLRRYHTKHRLVALAIWMIVIAQSGTVGAEQPRFSRYLFVWTGDQDRHDSDFLAVLNTDPQSSDYGRVLQTVPVNARGTNPHHTEHFLTPGHPLFAEGFTGNRAFRFDVSHPLAPKLLGDVAQSPGATFIHSFVRLPNGNVLATMQARDPEYNGPGGLVEFRDDGTVVRSASAATEDVDDNLMRPYSLLVVPDKDRVVVTDALMGLQSWSEHSEHYDHEHVGFHVQLWRLSDLRLLKTITLAAPEGSKLNLRPFEPRQLPNGEVLLATGTGGLYRVLGLEPETFTAQLVYDFECPQSSGTPLVVGHFWIQPLGGRNSVVVLDVSNPAEPIEVSRVRLDDKQRPHWLAYDPLGERIIVQGGADNRLWMLTFSPRSGALALDPRFRDPGSNRAGVSFEREQWLHGPSGNAIPHGSVFAD